MKKFVRKVKTFDPKGTQTPPGELYILDKVKGGPPDQEGGGLVRELPSKLIGRLRNDLKFAAVLQSGVSKNNGKLKDEMAAITRSAYVSKSIARERLGQVLKQKVSRGRESIQFFKHNLAKQKVASLKAAKVRVHDENLQLKTRVERRNHELSVQAMAMQAMGAVSSLDERTLNNKDVEITDLKAIVQKLHGDLQDERRRSEYIAKRKDDTQTQLYRAYSTLGKLAMKSGKASDKALMYELDDVNELPTYMDEEDKSNKIGREGGGGGNGEKNDDFVDTRNEDEASSQQRTTQQSQKQRQPPSSGCIFQGSGGHLTYRHLTYHQHHHHYTNEKNLINKTKTTSFLCSFTLHHTKKEAATSIPPQWKKVWATMADTCWSPGCHNISKITSTKRTIHSQTRHSSNNWKKKIKNSCWCARLLLGGTFSCAAQQHNGTPRGVPS